MAGDCANVSKSRRIADDCLRAELNSEFYIEALDAQSDIYQRNRRRLETHTIFYVGGVPNVVGVHRGYINQERGCRRSFQFRLGRINNVSGIFVVFPVESACYKSIIY